MLRFTSKSLNILGFVSTHEKRKRSWDAEQQANLTGFDRHISPAYLALSASGATDVH